MGLCLKKVEQTIEAMDKRYDANFGDWVRNEDNAKIVGINMRKYIGRYKESDFIVVVKWIMKDWTLKSIIVFSKKLIIDDILKCNGKEYQKRIKIITGFIYTCNPIFIAEFLLASTKEIESKAKAAFFVDILKAFKNKKLQDILVHMENQIDTKTQDEITKLFADGVYMKTGSDWDRTDSLVNAFTLL